MIYGAHKSARTEAQRARTSAHATSSDGSAKYARAFDSSGQEHDNPARSVPTTRDSMISVAPGHGSSQTYSPHPASAKAKEANVWIFLIRQGELYHNGRLACKAHSGNGLAMNDPGQVARKRIGPIPPGVYWFGPLRNSPVTGRNVMDLIPVLGTVTYGRTAFQCHGRNRTPDPSDDSEGCMVAEEPDRLAIDASGDRLLTVLTGDEGFIAKEIA